MPKPLNIKPIFLNRDEPSSNTTDFAAVVIGATDGQAEEKNFTDQEVIDDFVISSDALNILRVEWRLREEWGTVDPLVPERIRDKVCKARGYEREELDAALQAVAARPRLPYGWTALQVAAKRLETRPIVLLNSELEASRYARGVLAIAIHLQDIQKAKPILLPVEQVREILTAKKVVVAGTILNLVKLNLLEMTKAAYSTGSAREYKCLAVEGTDFQYIKSGAAAKASAGRK